MKGGKEGEELCLGCICGRCTLLYNLFLVTNFTSIYIFHIRDSFRTLLYCPIDIRSVQQNLLHFEFFI